MHRGQTRFETARHGEPCFDAKLLSEPHPLGAAQLFRPLKPPLLDAFQLFLPLQPLPLSAFQTAFVRAEPKQSKD